MYICKKLVKNFNNNETYFNGFGKKNSLLSDKSQASNKCDSLINTSRNSQNLQNFKICKISKNTFFTEHLWATASALHFVTLRSKQKHTMNRENN